MRYLLTLIAGIAVGNAWSTMWNLLLGLPTTFFRLKEEDRIRIREKQIGMGQLRWILTVGVLRSGLAFGLAVLTFDLLLDRSPHHWRYYEVAKFVLMSLAFGFFSGGASWHVTPRETPPSFLGPPPQSKR